MKTRIDPRVLELHERFEVDTDKVDFLLRANGVGEKAVKNLVLCFDARAPFFAKGSRRGIYGWHTPPFHGIHVVCGQPSDPIYQGEPCSVRSFEATIYHEIGHYLAFKRSVLGYTFQLPKTSEQEAEDFALANLPIHGQVVDYAFKQEFTVNRPGLQIPHLAESHAV